MRKEDFDQIKFDMKARRITGAYIAFQVDRSASQINNILRGNYPYYQGYGLPKYLYDWLVVNKLLKPTEEGYLTRRAADEPWGCPNCDATFPAYVLSCPCGYPRPAHR